MERRDFRLSPSDRIATDVGGTFTDVVSFDPGNGHLRFGKTLTTPLHLVDGIVDGINKAAVAFENASLFLHGTTIAINTILERTGAKTALLTTKGFRDVYEIGRINRPESYNLFFQKHVPLIPRSRRLEVNERTGARGEIIAAMVEPEIVDLAKRFAEDNVEAVAILFLHSYANPFHERLAKQIIERECPGIFVSASHELSQEYREFERTSTVAANAYVGPRVRSYLKEMNQRLAAEQFSGNFFVVQSNGGLCEPSIAERECIKLLESGPAAGVIGAKAICSRLGLDGAIAFDMGGTTAKAGVVKNGEVMMASNIMVGGYVSGLPVQIPLVDIQEVGTGGGSIARVVPGGGIRVGPESSGAAPGPVCYDRGGTEPTVTDANLILGRLAADRFLGGEMRLNQPAAEKMLREKIADPLGISVLKCASGILKIAATAMSNVVVRVTTERGLDIGDLPLLAYGGAGPLHAGLVARELRIQTVIIPPMPGHACAFGMLMSDLRRDLVRTWFRRLEGVNLNELSLLWRDIEASAIDDLRMTAIPEAAIVKRALDMRYVGQEHSVKVDLPPTLPDGTEIETIKSCFDAAHQERYGFSAPNEQAEIVSLHVSIIRELVKPAIDPLPSGDQSTPKPESMRNVFFDEYDDVQLTPIYWRSNLQAGAAIEGPAVVEEYASSTVLFPGDKLKVSPFGDLIITIGQQACRPS